MAERPRRSRQVLLKVLRRAAAPSLLTAAILTISPVAAASPPHPAPPVEVIGPIIENLDSGRGVGAYPLFANLDLHTGSAAARQALVMVHGRLRNASDYYATGLAMVKAAAAAAAPTVVVAPQFLDQTDATTHHLSDRFLRWNHDWENGTPAQSPASHQSGGAAASSYDVLDDIVAKLSNKPAFPSLHRIVFVGHGGGAQMLARYAVVMHPQPGPQPGPLVSFVIANAGTYLYPTTARPVRLPCPDFNQWKYGLDNPPPYVKAVANIANNFAAREVTLLLGTRDRKTNGVLDQSCAANTQGHNRLERGRYFAQILTARGMAPLLKYVVIPGVGHNESGMLLSRQAGEAIFPTGNVAR